MQNKGLKYRGQVSNSYEILISARTSQVCLSGTLAMSLDRQTDVRPSSLTSAHWRIPEEISDGFSSGYPEEIKRRKKENLYATVLILNKTIKANMTLCWLKTILVWVQHS